MSSTTVNSMRNEQCDQSARAEGAEADVYEVAVTVGLQFSDRQSRSVIGESRKQKGEDDPSVAATMRLFVDFALTSQRSTASP